jgi:hypothetical protein
MNTMPPFKINMTLSIGYSQGKHEDTLIVKDAPIELADDEEMLEEWLHENYWVEWANGYIDGGVSIVKET